MPVHLCTVCFVCVISYTIYVLCVQSELFVQFVGIYF